MKNAEALQIALDLINNVENSETPAEKLELATMVIKDMITEENRDKSFNGWKNWETWLLSLHITNTETTALLFDYIIKRGKTQGKEAKELQLWMEIDFAEVIKSCQIGGWRREFYQLLFTDALGGFLGEVDWDEIVESRKEK